MRAVGAGKPHRAPTLPRAPRHQLPLSDVSGAPLSAVNDPLGGKRGWNTTGFEGVQPVCLHRALCSAGARAWGCQPCDHGHEIPLHFIVEFVFCKRIQWKH